MALRRRRSATGKSFSASPLAAAEEAIHPAPPPAATCAQKAAAVVKALGKGALVRGQDRPSSEAHCVHTMNSTACGCLASVCQRDVAA